MLEPPRGGGGALDGGTCGLVAWSRVLPANVFRSHSSFARSGSRVPSAFGVIRLVLIAFCTALRATPRNRAYARCETPIIRTPGRQPIPRSPSNFSSEQSNFGLAFRRHRSDECVRCNASPRPTGEQT